MSKAACVVTSALLLCLLGGAATPAAAASDEVSWSRVNLPTEGRLGDWMLADGSDVEHLTAAIDGTLYCHADPTGTSRTLFKSTDDGNSWEYTDYDQAVTGIAPSGIDADTLYVTDGSDVYKSGDGGGEWESLSSPSGIAPITCIDIGYNSDSDPYVFIGTADGAAGGGVYYLPDIQFSKGWTDLDVGGYDVRSLACSPGFANDSQVIVVITDNARSYAAYNDGTGGNWERVELLDGGGAGFAISDASNISFPEDYSRDDVLLVGVVGGDGGVYEVDQDSAQRLDLDADIISLDTTGDWGELALLAGDNGDAAVWFSSDDGDSWQEASKPPSGDGPTYVLMGDGFPDSGEAYAATSGDESALSRTVDGGENWNQISLIDTAIGSLVDFAVSPENDQDGALFLLTFGGGNYSLWRTLNDGGRWQRVFSSDLPQVDNFSMVTLSPLYGNDSQVVFLAGESGGDPAMWRSADGGQSFASPKEPPYDIDAWAAVDDSTIVFTGFDGADGLVYHTTSSGSRFSTPVEVGNQQMTSLALSPGYGEDGNILVGNIAGWVYWSDDNGDSFQPLPQDASSAPLTDSVSVLFDPGFGDNSTVYAASDTVGAGIYRFVIGSDTVWENIDDPTDAVIKHLAASDDGILYGANSDADSGMERSLNPTYGSGPTFESLTRGLDDGVTLTKLHADGDRLWTIDTSNDRLMTLTDTLTAPVILTSPADEAPGIGVIIDNDVSGVTLDWETLGGATGYQWQLDDDANFYDIAAGFEGDVEASSTQLPDLEPATTYYWRARANDPVLSPWSQEWSFTTVLGTEAAAPQLLNPAFGASGVPTRPLFQWGSTAGADGYELVVCSDPDLASTTVLRTGVYALACTAWECNVDLSPNTTYYWKIRAVNADSYSAWSAVSAFTTEAPPLMMGSLADTPAEQPPQPPQPASLSPIAQATDGDWMKYTLGALISAVVLLVVVVMMLLKGAKKP